MKIAYLHGLESNNKGAKHDWLKSISEVYNPLINYREESIYSSIREDVKDFCPNVIIGSSMGGYFAYEIARELNINMLLFNPALHSRTYQPDMTAYIKGNYKPNLHLVLGINDKVIDPQKTINILKEQGYSDNNFKILNHAHSTPYDVFVNEINYFLEKMKI